MHGNVGWGILASAAVTVLTIIFVGIICVVTAAYRAAKKMWSKNG